MYRNLLIFNDFFQNLGISFSKTIIEFATSFFFKNSTTVQNFAQKKMAAKNQSFGTSSLASSVLLIL
jgi:hypothetical protein